MTLLFVVWLFNSSGEILLRNQRAETQRFAERCRVPRQPPVNLYCIHKPHSSSTVKSTMSATSATLAIVFMASTYIGADA